MHRTIQLSILTLAAAAVSYTQNALGPLQEAIRVTLDLTDNQMAVIQGPALSLPWAIMALPLGWIVDRHRRMTLVLLFSILNTLGSLLSAAAGGFLGLVCARVLVGLGPAVTIAAYSLIGDLYPAARRGHAFMILGIGQVAGMAVVYGASGALLAKSDGPQDWPMTMVWLSTPLVLVTLLTAFAREPSRAGPAVETASLPQAFVALWRHRAVVVPLTVGLTLGSIANTAAVVWVAPVLARGYGLATDRIGSLLAWGLLASGILGPIIGGMLADRSQRLGGPRRTIAVLAGVTLFTAPAAMFGVAPVASLSLSLWVVLLTAQIAVANTASPLCTILVPNQLRGLCFALLSTANTAIASLAPLGVSMVARTMGGASSLGQALSVVCLVASILAGMAFAWGRSRFSNGASTPLCVSTNKSV